MNVSCNRFRAVVLLVVLVMAGGCSQSDREGGGPLVSADGQLRFVPADTPYVLVTPGDMPDDLVDKLEPVVDRALRAYHDIIRAVVDNATVSDESPESAGLDEEARALFDSFGDLMSVEGLKAAGIDRDSDLAIYGVGLLPVLRLTLTGGDLMEAAISRLEDDAGRKMALASLDGHPYRYLGDADGRLIIGVFDDQLVVTVVPSGLSEEQLRQVLGFSLPEQNIATSGLLAAAAGRHGLADYVIGIIDVERLAATLLDDPAGINAELLAQMQYDNATLSDTCRAEIRGMAGIAPRVVAGYTAMSAAGISSKLVVELREDIAAGVATLTGSVPGLGKRQGGLFSMGFSIDPLAARDFYSSQLDKLEATPYQCELFADLQASVVTGRQILSQPVPPIVYGIRGFLAVVDDVAGFDPAGNLPPADIDLRLVLAMDNPEGLLAMGVMFSPELAALDLKPDGKPVRLDLPQVRATGQAVYLAMTDNALGVALGEGTEARLPALLDAPADDSSPFFSAEMDSGRYYEMLGDALADDNGLQQMPELRAAISDLTAVSRDLLDRAAVDVRFTEQGIEILSDVTLKP